LLKVLHVVDTLSAGGVETWLMELLRFWRREDPSAPRLDIVATSGNQGLYDGEARALGARVLYLRFGRSNLASFAGGWRRLLKSGGYNAIHDHQDYISGWHFLAGAGLLPPVRISHVHNPTVGLLANYNVSATRQLTARAGVKLVNLLATDICGTSAAILRRNGFEPGRALAPPVSVVHCGFAIDRFNAVREPDRASVLEEFHWPSHSKVVLSVGRLDRALSFNDPQNHKNTWFAVNVVRLAIARDSSVRYLVAGAGDEQRAALERHISDWRLEDKVRFIGVRHDIPRLMRAADLLLFPSVEEGLGMVAVEAQAAGLPVLASTAVPRECIVVPKLYMSMPLGESLDNWAVAVLDHAVRQRPPLDYCRRELQNSDFAIENSARNLLRIYRRMDERARRAA